MYSGARELEQSHPLPKAHRRVWFAFPTPLLVPQPSNSGSWGWSGSKGSGDLAMKRRRLLTLPESGAIRSPTKTPIRSWTPTRPRLPKSILGWLRRVPSHEPLGPHATQTTTGMKLHLRGLILFHHSTWVMDNDSHPYTFTSSNGTHSRSGPPGFRASKVRACAAQPVLSPSVHDAPSPLLCANRGVRVNHVGYAIFPVATGCARQSAIGRSAPGQAIHDRAVHENGPDWWRGIFARR